MAKDYRSPDADAYRHLYKLKAWAIARERTLVRDMFKCQHKGCGVHLTRGRNKPNSAVVHHIKPHKGDMTLFLDHDNLVSVCKRHHDGDIQAQEAKGYDDSIGQDGWPQDPKHPGNARR